MKTKKTRAIVGAVVAMSLVASTVRAQPVEVTAVRVVFKTHFDIGYTDTNENVLRKYREDMMENALKVIEQDRQLPPEKRFTWMIPGWPLASTRETK